MVVTIERARDDATLTAWRISLTCHTSSPRISSEARGEPTVSPPRGTTSRSTTYQQSSPRGAPPGAASGAEPSSTPWSTPSPQRASSAWTPLAEALAAFGASNYEHLYLRDATRDQAERVVVMLHTLVEQDAAHRTDRRAARRAPRAGGRLRRGDDVPLRLSQRPQAAPLARRPARRASTVKRRRPVRCQRA